MFDSQGFEIIRNVLSSDECESISEQISLAGPAIAGTRNILLEDWCKALVGTLRAHERLSRLIPKDFVAVQCTYFEKSIHRNWLVPVHQDLCIPVSARVENPNLSGWSMKEGTLFVQPPESLLSDLVAVRVHLDDCGPSDGPLKVIPASHKLGRIEQESALAIRDASSVVTCEVERGAALVMRPLLLHTSSKSIGQNRRRVLHFLFGPKELPFGLRWHQSV